MSAVKLLGIILIVATFTAAGFFKSLSLKSRCKKLSAFCDGLDTLYGYIEQGGCELSAAIKNSFCKCDFLHFENRKIVCCDNDLKGEKTEINEFFKDLGASAKKAECDRIGQFSLRLKKQLCEAEKDYAQKCRVYQTFGVCIGLAIGILLI